MVVVLVLGLLLVGVAVGLLARAALGSRLEAAELVGEIDSYGFGARRAPGSRTGGARHAGRRLSARGTVDSAASLVGSRLASRLGSLREEELRRQLRAAGFYTTPPGRLLGYQALGAVFLPVLWVWLAVSTDVHPLLVVLGAVVLLLVGWLAPVLFVRERARRRAARIDYEMPELIDLLVTTVEAGIAFGGSLRIAAQRFKGPLGQELRLTLQEQSMGLGLNESLEHFLERSDTPAVRSFVRSLVQGDSLGVSVGQTLRNLAVDMRKRRRQAASERAHQAPVKMLFPLVFLIFPSLFLILFGPAVMRIFGTF